MCVLVQQEGSLLLNVVVSQHVVLAGPGPLVVLLLLLLLLLMSVMSVSSVAVVVVVVVP